MSRLPRRARFALALAMAVGLLGAGCGGGGAGEKALGDTEAALDEIRSGRLSLRLLASTVDAPEGQGTGFQVDGPFAVGREVGSLPVADLRYTRITGSTRRVTRFVSTGRAAFVEVEGRTTRLTDQQVAGLRVTEDGSGGGLEGLSLRSWLDEPEVADGPAMDGAATEKVTGKADPIAILNDLIALSGQFGAGADVPARLEGDAADRVRRAAGETTAEVLTGAEDRLLRRADVSVTLAVVDPRVRQALGDLAGARLRMALEVTELNRPVQVADPTSR